MTTTAPQFPFVCAVCGNPQRQSMTSGHGTFSLNGFRDCPGVGKKAKPRRTR